MKKIALVVALFILLVGVFVPAMAVAAEGDSRVEYLQYRVPWGTNLTRIAMLSQSTVERLLEINPPGSKCVKNRNLVIAGCDLTLPLVAEHVHEVAVARATAHAYETGLQEGQQAVLPSLVIVGIIAMGLLTLIAFMLIGLAKKNNRIAELEGKYGKASSALKGKSRDLEYADDRIEGLERNLASLNTADGLQKLARGITVDELIKFLDTPTFGDGRNQKALKKLKEVFEEVRRERLLTVVDVAALEAMTLDHFVECLNRGYTKEV